MTRKRKQTAPTDFDIVNMSLTVYDTRDDKVFEAEVKSTRLVVPRVGDPYKAGSFFCIITAKTLDPTNQDRYILTARARYSDTRPPLVD